MGRVTHLERFGVGARIENRGFNHKSPQVLTRITFDGMQLVGMRMAFSVEPKAVVESDRVDYERVAIPSADGIAVPTRPPVGFRRMRAAVDADLAVTVDVG